MHYGAAVWFAVCVSSLGSLVYFFAVLGLLVLWCFVTALVWLFVYELVRLLVVMFDLCGRCSVLLDFRWYCLSWWFGWL